MIHAANVMIGEFRRLNGHLRALNARSGRIQKQVQREAEVVARGIDPRLAPRSSKNLNTSVAEAVIHLDFVEKESDSDHESFIETTKRRNENFRGMSMSY